VKKNGHRMLSLALVPIVAINLYAGSKMLKKNISEEKVEPKSITTHMVEFNNYREVSVESEVLETQGEVSETDVFSRLDKMYESAGKDFNELLSIEDKFSELYVSGLYAKLKSAGLSDEVIREEIDNILANKEKEILKQQKILARIYKLASQTVNGNSRISAITMWAQSDDMCFVDERCGHKVYGSVVDSSFNEKEFEPEKISEYQQFNYHTHTKLCGHAYGEMREYIENAIEAGYTVLGFSDHNPPAFGRRDPKVYMSKEQFFEEYLPVLKGLKEEYSDRIDISIGLEVEYYGDEGEKNETIVASRNEIEKELDYMILGQHFVIARDNDGKMMNPPKKSDPLSEKYPLDYAATVVEAIKTGKFAYVAHPDIFLRYRDGIPEDKKQEYNENVSTAIEMICDVASKYRIPLEINLGAITAYHEEIPGNWITKDNSYIYPVIDFWKVAAEKGCDVLIGVDAHSPDRFLSRDSENIAKKMMKDAKIDLHYLDSFEPLGIGKELNRISRGKKVLNQMLDLSDDVRDGEILEATGKIVRTQKDLASEKTIDEEQL